MVYIISTNKVKRPGIGTASMLDFIYKAYLFYLSVGKHHWKSHDMKKILIDSNKNI